MKKILFTLCLVLGMSVAAQAYPNRPVTLVVPFNAGGSMDSMTRIVAEYMKKELGKPVMVMNRPGASGAIGSSAFFKMKNDGYNVLVFPTSSFVAPVFQGRKPIESSKLAPVGGFIRSERILFARPDAPYKNFDELVAYARTRPGELKFGSGGDTGTAYVFRNMCAKAGIDVNVTLFNGGAPAAAAIMGGHVDLIEGGIGSPADVAARAGKLVRLNLLSDGRVEDAPELKNPLDMGYSYASSIILGMFLHADAPADARSVLSEAMQKALANKELLKKFASRGVTPHFYSAKEMSESIGTDQKVGELYRVLGKI